MKKFCYFVLILTCLLLTSMSLMAQNREHKVKGGETLFGIAHKYGLTLDEIKKVNPKMNQPGYVLKMDEVIIIPSRGGVSTIHAVENARQDVQVHLNEVLVADKKITVGVMLPLHNLNGDGKRMLEYYRGMLMAIGDLKIEGYNIEVNTWNVAEGDDLNFTVLNQSAVKRCDIIFGPLYSAQVPALAKFCQQNNIKLVIPFSISANDVQTCPAVYQVYQTPAKMNKTAIEQYVLAFPDVNTVIVDCNDSTSQKGSFTMALRDTLTTLGRPCHVTNIVSADDYFRMAFDEGKQNMVILNTGRAPELNRVFTKLDALRATNPSIRISMFGYNEWYLYLKVYEQKMREYDSYIPSYYNYKATRENTVRMEREYEKRFKTSMIQAIPRFAITGYDQAMFFLRGINTYGKSFNGVGSQPVSYQPVQTPLLFNQIPGGGYQNDEFMLIHFK